MFNAILYLDCQPSGQKKKKKKEKDLNGAEKEEKGLFTNDKHLIVCFFNKLAHTFQLWEESQWSKQV